MNVTRPRGLQEAGFATPVYGYRVPPGATLDEVLAPTFWTDERVLKQLRAGDILRIVDEAGPSITEVIVLGVNPYAAAETDKLKLAYKPVWPVDLALPQAAEVPELRVAYNRSNDAWEILDRDGNVRDQLPDEESAQRVAAAAFDARSGFETLKVAMVAARPERRGRGRPRKPVGSGQPESGPSMAAAGAED